jgi:hypothetical protein
MWWPDVLSSVVSRLSLGVPALLLAMHFACQRQAHGNAPCANGPCVFVSWPCAAKEVTGWGNSATLERRSRRCCKTPACRAS